MPPPADLATLSLAEVARALAEKRLPPVDQWHPAHCGDSEMRIARDGTWYHQGSPIGRADMVRLFASILRREPDGGFVLVTPGEKLDIAVEDAPFIAVEVKSEGEGEARRLAFRLNTGDLVVSGPDNAIRLEAGADGPRPYLHVRGGLDAAIARPVYYELAAIALDEDGARPGPVEQRRLLPDGRMTLAERVRASLDRTRHAGVPYASDMRSDAPVVIAQAAVLIALTDRPEPGLILTQRPETMRRHPGQVAFPGGKVDPGDRDAIAAALREAEEEIALPRSAVSVVDTMNLYRTVTGYEITPVIGVIDPDLPLVPHDEEVAAVFEVPLHFLLDPRQHRERTVMVEGGTRTYIEMLWGERRIWGATAAMLVNFATRLQW